MVSRIRAVASVALMVVAPFAAAAALGACTSGDDEPDGPPVLDLIDGPAQVDPSFDPSDQGRDATVPSATDGG